VWPIELSAGQSSALILQTRLYFHSLDENEMLRYQVAVILSQMERGIQIGLEEQDLLKHILVKRAEALDYEVDREFEDGYFKIFGSWPVYPAWWFGTIKIKP
jgi:hypothetical protein